LLPPRPERRGGGTGRYPLTQSLALITPSPLRPAAFVFVTCN